MEKELLASLETKVKMEKGKNVAQCHYRKKFGHVEKNCPDKNKHQANSIEEHDNKQHVFYAT